MFTWYLCDIEKVVENLFINKMENVDVREKEHWLRERWEWKNFESGMDKWAHIDTESQAHLSNSFSFYLFYLILFFLEKQNQIILFLNKWNLLFPSLSVLHVPPRDTSCAEFTIMRSMHLLLIFVSLYFFLLNCFLVKYLFYFYLFSVGSFIPYHLFHSSLLSWTYM